MNVRLMGLEGTSKIRRAVFIHSAAEAIRVLRKGLAATSAADHGAINVWKDRKGQYRVWAGQQLATKASETLTSLKDVRWWVSIWLRRIKNPALSSGGR